MKVNNAILFDMAKLVAHMLERTKISGIGGYLLRDEELNQNHDSPFFNQVIQGQVEKLLVIAFLFDLFIFFFQIDHNEHSL